MSTQAVHIVVHGKVQGVWFRGTTESKAEEFGLAGWVRNRPEGTVEIHAEGMKEDLQRLIEWCRQGPPSASVSRVDVEWVSPKGMKTFSTKYFQDE